MQGFGQKPYRARQVWEALYRQRVASVEDMTTLSHELRERLMTEGWSVGLPEIVQTARSVDGTERYLMRMADGETVETVWMPDGDGGERGDGSEAAEEEAAESVDAEEAVSGPKSGYWDRRGNGRANVELRHAGREGLPAGDDLHLEPGGVRGELPVLPDGEAGNQAEPDGGRDCGAGGGGAEPARRSQIGKDRINLVFMGMGEPFLNYDEFMKSVRLLVEAIGIPESRMTVSTSGILPGIERFAQERCGRSWR